MSSPRAARFAPRSARRPALRRALVATTASVALFGLASAGFPSEAAAQPRAAAQPTAARPAPAAPGSSSERIAAVVNDEVISISDVYARVRLALLNSGLPDTPEARQRLMPQVMRQLVDERLQTQEAKKLGITVSDAEVQKAVTAIAEQNKISAQQLQKVLAERSVPLSTLSMQLRATLAWQRVLQRRVRQEIVIGDEEIDAALERLKEDIGKPEYLLAEIFLAVDQSDNEDEVRRLAERLSEEVRRGGNFAAVARQFSQSAGAASGGDMGWVRQGELRSELDTALRSMRPGTLSPPIRSAEGYHILLVRAQRAVGSNQPVEAPPPPRQAAPRPQPPRFDLAKATVNLKQMIFPAVEPTDAGRKAAKDRAEAVRKSIKGCGDFDAKAAAAGSPESGDMGTLKVRDLPKPLQQLVLGIEIGQPSPVMSGPGGALLLIVCKRDAPVIAPPPAPEPAAAPPPPPPPPVDTAAAKTKLPERDEIERELVNQRAELLSRRYLRDLRRAAFIEYRS